MIFLLPFVIGGVGGDWLLIVIVCALGLMVSMEADVQQPENQFCKVVYITDVILTDM